ncbi:tRNA lysidine(34) synthetase TilS [Rhodopirellula baltica]|uniref:tRNA lysidine(34) synthetase TilS n=1 Tax=Rhodopirellula baltica TaxID=265606 RepID=UPI001E63DE43|nr:tRNA lysidine(34) synthetase TilS [Rhodopirellula baltica]
MLPTTPNESPNWHRLRRAIRSTWPNRHGRSSDVATLVGCSGGADSVALICLLAELWAEESNGLNPANETVTKPVAPLVVAHCNHGLRGEESNADEAFVRQICDQLQLPLVIHHVPPLNNSATSGPVSDERTLRQIRRDFFERAAKQHGCRYVAVAHSADDQAETMLHHFIRGTGPLGLAGIAEASELDTDIVVRRPLLQVRRDTLRDGLREIGQPWREDASNRHTIYTRNWIRHDVLPLIESRYPNAVEAIHRAGTLQHEMNEMVRRLAERWLEAFTDFSGDRWTIHTERLSKSATPEKRMDDTNAACSWMIERPVIVAASQLAWDRLGWSRGSMTMQHWQRLTGLINDQSCWHTSDIDVSTSQAVDGIDHGGHFPGGICLSVEAKQLVLRSE